MNENITQNDLLAEAHDLTEGLSGENPEYERALIENANRLLGRTSDDIEVTESEIRNMDDSERLLILRMEAAAKVELALGELFIAFDGDETEMGECFDACWAAARTTFNEEAADAAA